MKQLPTRNPIAFIANKLRVKLELPVEIIKGHVLRNASVEEEEEIQDAVRLHSGPLVSLSIEHRIPASFPLLVVEAVERDRKKAINQGFIEIEDAARLTDVECDLSLVRFEHGYGAGSVIGRSLFPKLEVFRPIVEIGEEWLREFRNLATLMDAATPPPHSDVSRALLSFRQLDALPERHFLNPLGLFSVIELLLTHDPKGNYDSLRHQVSTKIPLLQNFFGMGLDYSVFDSASLDTIWKKLYDLRSCIAHGGIIDFQKDLNVLKDLTGATGFLRKVTKRLIILGLQNPRLLTDLKAV